MKRILFCSFMMLLLLTSEVYAHGLYLSAEGGRLHANFSDHSPASGAVVIVVDDDGIELIRDTLDEKGIWTLPENIAGMPKVVIVEAPGGHLARITWQEALRGTTRGFFDSLGVRIAIGTASLIGGGFLLKRLLIRKSNI